MNQYVIEGTIGGHLQTLTQVVDAVNIEEAHEEAEDRFDVVTRVAGPIQRETFPEVTA